MFQRIDAEGFFTVSQRERKPESAEALRTAKGADRKRRHQKGIDECQAGEPQDGARVPLSPGQQ